MLFFFQTMAVSTQASGMKCRLAAPLKHEPLLGSAKRASNPFLQVKHILEEP